MGGCRRTGNREPRTCRRRGVMEPRIQYAETNDRVSIAYCVAGEGAPLVHLPWFPMSHLQAEWRVPELRHWYERLAKGRMLVRFDGRGTGLSEQEVTDFTLDARLSDLDAVVDCLKLEKFGLYAPLHSGPVAIAYAARHPERVSHLALWCTYALASDWYGTQVVQAVLALADVDWQTFTETAIGTFAAGWGAGEFAHRVALLFQDSLTQQAYQIFLPALKAVDVTQILPQVPAPTLVLHRRQVTQLGVNVARGLAARIPNARLALLEGQSVYEVFGDTEPVATALEEFLSEGQRELPAAGASVPSGTAIILFADIVDSTALTERMGDTAFREKARELDTALRTVIRECEGTPVEGKLLGDGVLAVFTSARQAIEAALACGRAGDEGGLPLHLGIHAGDVIREGDNVYGGAVNIASRISGLSAPGEVLVSETVRSLARTSAGVGFEERGEQSLKGMGEPVRVWAVRER
jgi:class 3 adenylate cyclase